MTLPFSDNICEQLHQIGYNYILWKLADATDSYIDCKQKSLVKKNSRAKDFSICFKSTIHYVLSNYFSKNLKKRTFLWKHKRCIQHISKNNKNYNKVWREYITKENTMNSTFIIKCFYLKGNMLNDLGCFFFI